MPALVPLAMIFLLGRKGDVPRAREIDPSWNDAASFAPLGCSFWSDPPAARAMQLLQLLGRVRCVRLDLGFPDSTALFLESMVDTI